MFEANAGVPQGAPISCVLFNVYLDAFLKYLFKRADVEREGFNLNNCTLAYADDLVTQLPPKLLGRFVRDFCRHAKQFGMRIGPAKCLIQARNATIANQIRKDAVQRAFDETDEEARDRSGIPIAGKAKEYKYLGVMISLLNMETAATLKRNLPPHSARWVSTSGVTLREKELLARALSSSKLAYRLTPLLSQKNVAKAHDMYDRFMKKAIFPSGVPGVSFDVLK